jgi:hypothetical protein
MSLISQLNKLGKAVNWEYPNINYGGCCVYAALVAEALLLHKVNVRGIVASREAWDFNRYNSIDDIRPHIKHHTINRWQDNGVDFSHIGLEFEINGKLRHYDSTGVKRPARVFSNMPIYKGRLQVYELVKLAGKAQGWNTAFNRRHIPKIRAMVQDYLAIDKV